MSITDELRDWVANHYSGWTSKQAKGFAIADRIDEAHESACAEAYGHGVESVVLHDMTAYIKLPVDADGEPIHIGDVMDTEHFGTVEVEGFVHHSVAFYNYSEQPAYLCMTPANLCHHHHEPTVEDVLREFTDAILEWSGKSGSVADTGTWSDVAAEYIKRLTLADGVVK